MRTAIISDIHGNLPALQLVLQKLNKQGVDRTICLGDLVEGGHHNDEVVELIMKQKIQTVIGNHDEINDCNLTNENQEWLSQLPEQIREKNILFTHISPRKYRKQKISDNIEAWNVFNEEDFTLCFVGHTHFPMLFGEKNDVIGESKILSFDKGIFQIEKEDRYIISFGAVGYPRKGENKIRYGIYDSDKNRVEFIKIEGPLLKYGSNT